MLHCIYMHVCIYVHTYIHTCILTCMYAPLHMYVCVHIHAYIHTYMYTHLHRCSIAYAAMVSRTLIVYTYIHTCIHTHIHVYSLASMLHCICSHGLAHPDSEIIVDLLHTEILTYRHERILTIVIRFSAGPVCVCVCA